MYQCQYNRQSFNPKNPKQWLPIASYGHPVESMDEARELMRLFKRVYKHEMGEACDLQLRIAKI